MLDSVCTSCVSYLRYPACINNDEVVHAVDVLFNILIIAYLLYFFVQYDEFTVQCQSSFKKDETIMGASNNSSLQRRQSFNLVVLVSVSSGRTSNCLYALNLRNAGESLLHISKTLAKCSKSDRTRPTKKDPLLISFYFKWC